MYITIYLKIVRSMKTGRTEFPESYYSNSDKEKVALLYAENFRRQFSTVYPNRKLLFLATENECGVQVSSFPKCNSNLISLII